MKCNICSGEVISKELYRGDYDSINVGVVGDLIAIYGHTKCLQAVNSLVVIPNRLRVMGVKK